jgi:hypothetical protein
VQARRLHIALRGEAGVTVTATTTMQSSMYTNLVVFLASDLGVAHIRVFVQSDVVDVVEHVHLSVTIARS